MEFDVILRGGLVLDGTGSPAQRADVGLTRDRIAAIDDLADATAALDVDATGRVVCPGFVDVHAHTDLTGLLDDEHGAVKVAGIRQGVTTEVCGNCGFSPFPALPDELDPNDPYLGLLPAGTGRYFTSLAAYRDAMDEVPLVANLAPLVGHGRIRSVAMGPDDRPPTDAELATMRRLVAQAMDEGAFGLSSGLIYAPGVYSDTDELVELATVAGRHGRPYVTHMRNEGDRVTIAVDEALAIGRRAGTAVQVSHHKVAGRHNWGRSQDTLARIEQARASGVDATIDVYPYTAGSTFLSALLPPWALDSGPSVLLERLRDATARARMGKDVRNGLPGWENLVDMAGWHNVIIAGEGPAVGHDVATLAANAGMPEIDQVASLLLDDPRTLIIIHLMDDAEVVAIGDQPFAMVGSDGVPVPGSQHPRLAGTFARVLSRHRADADALADLVRRMTSLPAQRYGLADRGHLAPGAIADVVVFDPATVVDRATYDQPLLPPVGIDHVLVAGQFVVRDGAVTAARPGAVLEPR